ncbi:hypothetical protein LINGRAHAP2_LOCUS13807 [Linum grandiflorum]
MSSRHIVAPYVGPMHRNNNMALRFSEDFQYREAMKLFKPQISGFDRYGFVSPHRFIHNLGWGPFLMYHPDQYCPSAMQKFFCNLEVTCPSPFQAQTVIDGRTVLLTHEILSETLVVPIGGVLFSTETEVRAHGFNFEEAGRALCLTPPDQPTNFLALHLPEDLRVFHWFISMIFLPRSFSWDTVLPMDVWVLHNAYFGQALSLAHLLMPLLIDASSSFFTGLLPHAPHITKLLHSVGVNLSDNVLHHPVYLLRPQHILWRVLSQAAPLKPEPAVEGEISSFLDLIQPRQYNSGFCCDSHELVGKLDAFMEALEEKVGNNQTLRSLVNLKARCVMEKAKIKLALQLDDKVEELANKLLGRMDWSPDELDNVNFGKTLIAQEAKNKLRKILEDAENCSGQSDYESDPNVEF